MPGISNHDLSVLVNIEEGLNVYVLDESFCYVFFNDVHRDDMKTVFGAEIQVGASKPSYLPENFAADFTDLYQRAFNQQVDRHVLKFDDQYTEFRFFTFKSEGDQRLLVKTKDITSDITLSKELEKYQEKLEEVVQKRTQEANQQRDFFQQLIDEDPSLIFLRDKHGVYRLVNRSMADILGKPIENIVGRPTNEVIESPNVVEKYLDEDREIISSGVPVSDVRPFDESKHQGLWLSVSKKRVQIGGHYFVLGVMSNISDLVKTKRQLEATNEELGSTISELKEMQLRLVTTEKIASMMLLTSGFMHEISNPINYVSGNVQPLRLDVEELKGWIDDSAYLDDKPEAKKDFEVVSDEIDTLLNGIEEGTLRVKSLVHNLKKLSYGQPDEEASCDVNEILAGVLTMLSLMLEQKEVHIKSSYLENSPLIHVNPNYLNQLLINVLDFVISRMQSGEDLQISTALQEGELVVNILDENRSLPEEEVNRMVMPFDKIQEGTRVGLAVSYRIATKINARIETKEELSSTHFVLTIPVK